MALPDLSPQAQRRTPEELVTWLHAFKLNLKFSVGVWCLSPAASRFHEKYKPDLTIKQRLDVAASLADAGLAGLEAHYPNEINEDNLELWRNFSRDTGLRIVTVAPQLFYDAQFEFGSLSSPIRTVRDVAIERTKRALQLNQALDTDFAVVWSGSDGYENPFGLDLTTARNRFAEGLAAALDAVPGVRVAFEPKPYEPRGRHLYGTTAEGLLLALKVESLLRHRLNRGLLKDGYALAALNPEIGHVLMAYEDLPYAFSLALEYGRLAHLHVNSQPPGNYDQDLNAGVIAPEQLEAALYVLKMHGYQGWFGLDINPERQPADRAIRNSMDAIRAANDRINALDHEKIIWATTHPDRERGWLEAYLLRRRAAFPEKLAPLPDPPRE